MPGGWTILPWIAGLCAGLVLAAGCRPAAAPLTFSEAGLRPPKPPSALERPADPVKRSVDRLLRAVERELGLGWSPEDEAGALRRARRRSSGWSVERSELAVAVLTALDRGGVLRTSAEDARQLLRWDRGLGAPWAEVDRALIEEALRRLEEVLGSDAPAEDPPAVADTRPLLVWPVEPVRVTSSFGVRTDPFGVGDRMHGGIDLAAPEGQPVWCAAAGRVRFAGWRGGYGLSVEVEHEGGMVTRYAHLSKVDVQEGQPVEQGRLLGRAGASGRATGPHLHFEVWRFGLPVDPLDELPLDARYSAAGDP